MKQTSSIALPLMLLLGISLTVAGEPSPYVGMDTREIKSMSKDAISGYLEGKGMGFAMAAELNSYPGPKHVLELADRLNLSDEQIEATRAAYDAMREAAVRAGAEFIEHERALDDLFAARTADPEALRSAIEAAAAARAELRFAHLNAHLAMVDVMTAEQISAYDRLRGYSERADRSGAAGHTVRH